MARTSHDGAFGWPPILRTALAKVYTQRSGSTITRAVKDGELRAAGRNGRSLTFRREDLDAWLIGPASTHVAPALPLPAPRDVARPYAMPADISERLAATKRGAR